jgi:hypothetical protein
MLRVGRFHNAAGTGRFPNSITALLGSLPLQWLAEPAQKLLDTGL